MKKTGKRRKSGKADCILKIEVRRVVPREPFAIEKEINAKQGGDGALNANYQMFECGCKISSLLGKQAGLIYGKDFVIKTGNSAELVFEFRTQRACNIAKERLVDFFPENRMRCMDGVSPCIPRGNSICAGCGG